MPLTVLIVDDSAAIRKILQRCLVHADLPLSGVVEAGDGIEALKALESRSVDIILSDINMPNMDGLELLSRLKAAEATRDIPVVLITTEGSSAKVMEAATNGAAGYLKKPFTPEQIKEKLLGLI